MSAVVPANCGALDQNALADADRQDHGQTQTQQIKYGLHDSDLGPAPSFIAAGTAPAIAQRPDQITNQSVLFPSCPSTE